MKRLEEHHNLNNEASSEDNSGLKFEILEVVHKWVRDYIKYYFARYHKNYINYIFVIDGAGVRKSHLLKNVHIN